MSNGRAAQYQAMLTTRLIAELENAYSPCVVPPCRLCGAPLSIVSIGEASAIYRCSKTRTAQTQDEWEHYKSSEWVDYRPGGDPRVIELIARHKALRNGAKRAMASGYPMIEGFIY